MNVLTKEIDLIIHHLEQCLLRSAFTTTVKAIQDEVPAVTGFFFSACHCWQVLKPSAEQLEQSKREAQPPEALVLVECGEKMVTLGKFPYLSDSDDAVTWGYSIQLIAICGDLLRQLLFAHHPGQRHGPPSVGDGVYDPVASEPCRS